MDIYNARSRKYVVSGQALYMYNKNAASNRIRSLLREYSLKKKFEENHPKHLEILIKITQIRLYLLVCFAALHSKN